MDILFRNTGSKFNPNEFQLNEIGNDNDNDELADDEESFEEAEDDEMAPRNFLNGIY